MDQVLISSTEVGFSVMASDEKGEALAPEAVDALEEDVRSIIEEKLLKYQEILQEMISSLPLIERKRIEHRKSNGFFL